MIKSIRLRETATHRERGGEREGGREIVWRASPSREEKGSGVVPIRDLFLYSAVQSDSYT